MRISSGSIFDTNVATMMQQQGSMMHTQQQISTGRRILTASDDPVAAARALDVTQADVINTTQTTNRDAARHNLSMTESTLQAVTTLLQDVRTVAVAAGNGSLSDGDRLGMAVELNGRLQELHGLSNVTDGIGNYLFSGFKTGSIPFVNLAGTMTYNGDDGKRLIQVASTRQMPVNENGADVFMRIKNGNGVFVTQQNPANTGSGVVSTGSVVNPGAVTGNNYTLAFSVVPNAIPGLPDVTTYGLTNTTTGLPVIPAGTPYVSGQAITFDGIQFDIRGVPANLDNFTVGPSTNESIFKTVSDLITALQTPRVGANVINSVSRGLQHLDNDLTNVLRVRTTLGLRLNELDTLQTTSDDMGIQFKQTLSKLQDTDYAKAISDITQQQMALTATQKTFMKVAELSLFNYM